MYTDFEKWLNKILKKGFPAGVAAIHFNLYEENDFNWAIQLVATKYFNANDEDWACDEIFTTGENLFRWNQHSDWEEILDIASDLVNQYLECGQYAANLKQYMAVGIGFVDGDIKILYQQ